MLDSARLRSWLIDQQGELTQQQYADRLNTSQPTVNRWLQKDDYGFRLDMVVEIARSFGFKRLSDFVLHVEQGMKTAEPSAHGGTAHDSQVPAPAGTADELYRLADAFYAAASATEALTDGRPKIRRPRGRRAVARKSSSKDR